jgi:DNA-binding beta-propeller fold protein YncE
VRAAVTPDGASVYVTARGDNHVLAFDARALEADPSHAFRLAIPSGGEEPVGLEFFNRGNAMLVANANNLTNGQGSITVFDLSDPAKPVLRQTIKTRQFPRNISLSADETRLYLTEFLGDELMVLEPK